MVPDDLELINGLLANNSKLIRIIYRRNFPEIRRYVRRNSGNTQDAENVFQETLIVLYRLVKKQDFKLFGSLNGLIFNIARNIWLKVLRTAKEENVAEPEMLDRLDSSDEKVMLDSIKYSIYRKAFSKLSSGCKRIFKLSFEGKTASEISNLLNFRSEGYVRKRKHQCKQKIIALIKLDPLYALIKQYHG